MRNMLLNFCLFIGLMLIAIPLRAQDKPRTDEAPSKEEQARIANIEKGMVEFNDKWIPQKDYDKKMAAERAEYAAEEKKTRKLLGQDYRLEYIEGFVVMTNVPPEECKLFFQILVDFRKQFLRDFGKVFAIRGMDIPFNIYFFNTREEYVKGAVLVEPKASETVQTADGAYAEMEYPITDVKICLFKDTSRKMVQYDYYVRTAMHESTHAFFGNRVLMHYSEKTIGAALAEGLAIYFEYPRYREKSRSFKWGTEVCWRHTLPKDKRGIPIRDILRYSRQDFYSNDGDLNYAQMEAFTIYLMNYGEGKYRMNFLKFITSFNNKKEKETDVVKRLEKYIGIPIAQMEEECSKYTAEQRK
jgi:hypothetical protein